MVWLQLAVLALASPSADQAVLLDFYSDTCPPCRRMAPVIDELAQRGYTIQRINVGHRPDLAQKHNVQLLPCFIMMAGDREVDRVVGLSSYGRLAEMFRTASEKIQPPPSAPASMPPKMPSEPNLATSLPAVSSQPVLTTVPLQPISRHPEVSGIRPVSMTMPSGTTSANSSWTPRPASAPPTDEQLIAASVRLRIADYPSGSSCGSGTIIDARRGWALVLTCGHILRDSQILHDPRNYHDAQGGEGIEVDLFGPGGPRRVAGELVACNLDRDIGLLRIRTPQPVTVARVAPAGHWIDVGEVVASVGCNNGAAPTVVRTHIRSRDRFLPPPNLQTDGQPVEGRSGGGLFTQDGELIGVCNARDEQENQGLFAALASIQEELDRAGLAYVYQQDETSAVPNSVPSAVPPVGPTSALAQIQNHNQTISPPLLPAQMPAAPALMPAADLGVRPTSVRSDGTPARPLSPAEQAALEEIVRRQSEGAEVICIIRPRNNPRANSDVLVLDKASPEFLQQLSALSSRSPAQGGDALMGKAAEQHSNFVRSTVPPPGSAAPLQPIGQYAPPAASPSGPHPGSFWPSQQGQPMSGR
ncbi:MAG: trypsin-like peptidase domain-containing protein [Pirellulales bacterium]|nr:trypsin-like peptidase domain-containing protein [Pirellulales bacterium]